MSMALPLSSTRPTSGASQSRRTSQLTSELVVNPTQSEVPSSISAPKEDLYSVASSTSSLYSTTGTTKLKASDILKRLTVARESEIQRRQSNSDDTAETMALLKQFGDESRRASINASTTSMTSTSTSAKKPFTVLRRFEGWISGEYGHFIEKLENDRSVQW
ncbi:hypothetical protein BCR33DRAFT_718639 [Rhizoclosmatium globosum]|uniref:Uncharacterized protein n=1 Tax=Rhizoclosmatium globosum TaxID=329046 RepID=A0A1Y2C4Y9_9FUNG|nr:hypothetical protein BCR33DRAFT_718639 [Rhizoclosmatium globosum]|eukprot:ORY42006.1 hypothetical protein BCR33DRAFT_718639 [Rhizoclosmatium globosum]